MSRTAAHISDDEIQELDTISEKNEVVDIENASIHEEDRARQTPMLLRDLSPEQYARLEKDLVKKIDLRLLPCIIVMYILNYLDRNNIAAARLAGLEEDLGLKGSEYETCVSILFVGYVSAQIPSNIYLNKLGRPALYLCCAMSAWGAVSTATGACGSFAGLLICRLMLGFLEAAFFPGCFFALSCWYTRKELGIRTSLLFIGSLISGAFSGLIAAGITDGMDGVAGLLAWRWLFILEGLATVLAAFVSYFIMPNFPRTTKWLSEEERELAIWRLTLDIGVDDWDETGEQGWRYGLKLAVKDIKMWVLLVLLFCIAYSASIINVFPTIVATLNYNRVNSLLLTAPPYLLCCITACLNAWHADRTGERYWHVTWSLYIAIAANILAASTTAIAPRYLAMVLMIPGVYSGYSVVLAWISNSMPRPPAKRASAIAVINSFLNTANIYAVYMYPDSQGPRYIVAFSVNSATALIAVLAATVLKIILVRSNKRLERGEVVDGLDGVKTGVVEDGEAKKGGFRFLV